MPVRENFDGISDDELDTLAASLLHITPQAGLNLVLGAIRGPGLRIQRERIHDAMIRVDPITLTLRNARHVVRNTTLPVRILYGKFSFLPLEKTFVRAVVLL